MSLTYTPDTEIPARRGEVKIRHDDAVIFVGLGDGPVQITDGLGGWQEVERPFDLSLTRWAGQTPLRLSLPLLLDGYAERRGVQRDLDRIIRLGRSKDGDEQPPVFRVSGAVPFSGAKWVMEEMPEMGEVIRGRDGKLLRQALTLSLCEYVRPDRIKIKRRRSKTYVTKKGDTLLEIAAKLRPHDNNAETIDYAKEIAKRNKIRDIRKHLDGGIRLRLP